MIPRVPDLVRAGALGGALLLALLSRGDVIVLAAVLAVLVWRPLPAVAVVGALAAAALRWRSVALEDISGAQAVLGSAGLVGPTTAAASAWLGAVALVTAAPRRREGDGPPEALLVALALGAAAALVVAGAAPGGALWQRGLATVVATALAGGVEMGRRDGRRTTWLDGVSLAAALGAVVLAAVAVRRSGAPVDVRVDVATFVEGLAIGAAGAAVAVAVVLLRRALGNPAA